MHLKFCPATATRNFKRVEITHICSIWDQTFENFVVQTLILFPIDI